MNEVIITVVSTAMVAIVAGLLIAFQRANEAKDKLHAAELKRREESCATDLARRDKTIETLEKDLTENRLYAAGLETENDALFMVAGGLRDKCSMLQTLLDANKIEIPAERRNITKPLRAMIAEAKAEKNQGKAGQ